jgi:SnoaL-like domain
MCHNISNLLISSLEGVFGEGNSARRREVIDEIFHEDAVYYQPNGAYRGRDEIHDIAGVIKATHPNFRYQPIAPPEELGDGNRVRWVSGIPAMVPAYAGTAFIIVRDGRIAALYHFFDKLR